MDSKQIRHQFLDYFKRRGHEIVESSSLIPKDDPTLLFTNAGMVQFKSLFLGNEKKNYVRAATCQKCVRAGGKHNDLESVGYTPRHHTFFEMLGNFSFGDYFKEEAVSWAWELLTQEYQIPAERLYVSVYKDDEEAYRIWSDTIGLPPERVVHLGRQDNFWAMGDTGPCGPCSEIYFDQGPSMGCGTTKCGPGCDCDRYLEIWNLVFTQYNRSPEGILTPLPRPNIDTGMGLERLAAVIQGADSNYGTDLFRNIIHWIENLSEKKYGENEKSDIAFRVISDHARATAFLIGDGIMPSNEGRGYVLRRIIRRAVRFGQVLGLTRLFLCSVCTKVIETMSEHYAELRQSQRFIEGVVENEEKRFADTLRYSMKVLDEEIHELKARGDHTIPGGVVFKLYDTYGLPADIVEDVARDEELAVDWEGYQNAMSTQRSKSQESWKGSGEEEIPQAYRHLMGQGIKTRFVGHDTLEADAKVIAVLKDGNHAPEINEGDQAEIVLDQTPFYGRAGGQVGDVGVLMTQQSVFEVSDTLKIGQHLFVHSGCFKQGVFFVGDSVKAKVDYLKRKSTALNHSSTHLLHKALREVLGDHVKQAGSLVAPDRLRFDFSHFTQVDLEKLWEVENRVNAYIRDNLPIKTEEMAKDEAMTTGATAIFEERYGETVRVVQMGQNISMELCGGTHAERTGDIGLFRIISESAVAANVRRIEALTGHAALKYDQIQDKNLRTAAALLKTVPNQVPERIERFLVEYKEKEKEIGALKSSLLAKKSKDVLSNAKEVGGIKIVSLEMEADSQKVLRDSAEKIRDKLGSGIVLLGARQNEKAMLVCMVSNDLTNRFRAGDIIGQLSPLVGGKGGGRPDMAQGGGSAPENLAKALSRVYDLVKGVAGQD